jgi:flagellar assembly protein FliH
MTEPAARAFAFETEFTPNGEVIGGPARKYLTRQEADILAAEARAEGERKTAQSVDARSAAHIERIAGQLHPVQPRLAELADQLRREAAELAMIAAKRIAGAALDANGIENAAQAIEQAIRLLKSGPSVIVTAAAEAQPEIERRIAGVPRLPGAGAITVMADAKARPGDWKIEWAEGAIGFSREDVEAAIDAIIEQRLEDPIEDQLDLFAA